MSLLFNTHVVLWWLTGDPAPSAKAKDRLDHEPDIYVSAATVWEVAIKQSIGKLQQPADLPERITGAGPLGSVFGSGTTTRVDLSAPAVAVDISRIGEADSALTAAAMLAAWSDWLGCVEAAHALADAFFGTSAVVLRRA